MHEPELKLMETTALQSADLRPLARKDLDAMVAIDAAIVGYPRRDYFERRLAAAVREPARHAQFVATDERGPAGYLLGRVLEGEFGRTEPALRLEVIVVRPDSQGQGLGTRLLAGLVNFALRHSIREIRTAAAWNDHRMTSWLDAMGFRLAANHIIECPVAGGSYQPQRDDSRPPQPEGANEANYADRDEFERLARDNVEVSGLSAQDLPDVVRIDRLNTDRDRDRYMEHKLYEALQEGSIRVSLTARRDGIIAGFLMARADLGDFGRTAPVAVLDTIGVDPDYWHLGIGHALLSQLFVNLGALRIETVETVVAPRDLKLLGFFYDVGFSPSQRLPFVLAVD
jgi:GNAT superfamily N-acetyltransferase